MAVSNSWVCCCLAFLWFSITFSKPLQPAPNANLTKPYEKTSRNVALSWRSAALEQYTDITNSTLRRRECWIMKVGPEENWRQDEVKCTDKKAPTMAEMIAHGRNGTEFGKADAAHVPVFYTDWKNPALGAAGGLAGTNPSEKILWYINRSFAGYKSDQTGCGGGLVLDKKVYTYSDMTRDSWFIAQAAELKNNPEDYPDYVTPKYGFSQLMTFTWCYCQSLARAAMPASGEAWVAMPWDTEDWAWLPESNWNLNELPALTQNPAIQTIWRFDPHWYFYNPEKVWESEVAKIKGSLPRILWQRGNPEYNGQYVIQNEFTCPL